MIVWIAPPRPTWTIPRGRGEISQRFMNTGWTDLPSPPAPYLHACRRTTEAGLHVIVAIRSAGDQFEAYSIVDHGTPLKTIRKEGCGASVDEVVRLAQSVCDSYQQDGGSSVLAARRYSYLDKVGKLRAGASRDQLFELVARGELGWDAQIWDGRQWVSLDESIGFAQIRTGGAW